MKSLSFRATPENISAAIDTLKSIDPHLVVITGATDKMQNVAAFKSLSQALPGAQIIGCSTSGEIDAKGVSDKGLVVAAAHFDKSRVKSVSHELKSAADSRTVGKDIAASLQGSDLRLVFILAPGVNINGSELVAGVRSVLPADVVVTGGLAGDGTRFQETRTLLNGDSFPSHVVAIGLYGKDLSIGSGSRGGWKPFGPAQHDRSDPHDLECRSRGELLDLRRRYARRQPCLFDACGS